MSTPLKLGAIEQEHLQELYEAAGIPRDDLPYSPELTQLCKDFQDRAFRNADEPQVYGALLKYVRSSKCSTSATVDPAVTAAYAAQAAQLKASQPGAAKLRPYTPAFDSAREAFAKTREAGAPELSPRDFWNIIKLSSRRAAPPPRKALAAARA